MTPGFAGVGDCRESGGTVHRQTAMVALSQTIYTHRKRYYEMLGAGDKKIPIEGWLDYFAKTCLNRRRKF